ncbi:hypothetical protein [Streptomyces sp. NPDC057413]|uniref:hypothetical protein n=1 Tax=Streptomyces sp. NPDC057413 TaxID=3346124 RepID=UPI0036BD2AE4
MRTVSRDAFLPGLALENAYTDQAVTIKDNPGKPLPLSCASVPSVVAVMLEQLDARAAAMSSRSGRAPATTPPSWPRSPTMAASRPSTSTPTSPCTLVPGSTPPGTSTSP